MKDFATKYIKWYDSVPLWAKVLLCFLWAIPAGLYRFSKSALADNTMGMVLAVIVTLIGGEIVFFLDIITLILKGKIFWLDELNEVMSTESAPSEEAPATEEAPAEEAPVADEADAE
ncbi:MAG: hypothetical protein IKD35_04240 [Clostridia bacterium]|nr:hypothetical protein [Clostridia bacterium]